LALEEPPQIKYTNCAKCGKKIEVPKLWIGDPIISTSEFVYLDNVEHPLCDKDRKRYNNFLMEMFLGSKFIRN